MDTIKTLPVGMLVGAQRWPYHANHPGCWQAPWRGELLAVNDVRAWRGSIAVGGNPTQADVDRHIEWCKSTIPGGMSPSVPVLWDFGDHQKVYWESITSVRPYSEDVAEWRAERDRAMGFTVRIAQVG